MVDYETTRLTTTGLYYVRRFLLFTKKGGDSSISYFILEASESLKYGDD